MGYYLLDHPNKYNRNYYTTRQKPVKLIVLHTAERLPDYTLPDDGAEGLARYASTTPRRVSWHSSVDSDSIIPMLPDEYTAWHVRNYNSQALGIEMNTQAHRWYENTKYEDALVDNAAQVGAVWAKKFSIPIRKISKAEADSGMKGFTGHTDLDPTRRRDPGRNFDWDAYLERVLRYTVLVEYFWKFLALADLIDGDPAWYYGGGATPAEKDHAVQVAADAYKSGKSGLTIAELIERLKT